MRLRVYSFLNHIGQAVSLSAIQANDPLAFHPQRRQAKQSMAASTEEEEIQWLNHCRHPSLCRF